ncbi:MAG: MFS protein [Gammaproteobacteria bacterium]|nr:MFS protein [Gammaproteobacteria bacterium]
MTNLYRYYIVIVLVLVNTVNFIDRQVVSILAPAIKADLVLSDTQLGVLMGLAFTLFYATLGLPIGRLADKHARVNVLTIVLTLWSAMTALCSTAANYIVLLLMRVGVGVGEAGAGPCSHSLISDLFSREERPRAIGIFSLGVPFGTLFGFLFGGLLAEEFGWRMTFLIVGLPGVALAVLVKMTIREPARGAKDEGVQLNRDEVSLIEGLSIMWRIGTFRTMAYGGALSAFCGYAVNSWTPSFFARTHELGAGEMALPMAISLGVGGGLGSFLGGIITSRMALRDARAFLTLPGWSFVIFGIALVFELWSSSLMVAYAALFIVGFMQFVLFGPFFGLVQSLAPLRARALATAFIFFIYSGFGFGFGPLYVGALSDFLTTSLGEAQALQYALSTIPVISIIAGLIVLARRAGVVEDLAR